MSVKKRLDAAVLERGYAESRERAKALIMEGRVFVNGRKAEKAGEQVSEEAHITVTEGLKYVSRGGLKLERAIEEFSIDLEGSICADIGASTGGFTDCMLQNGAARVYAIDVGYGQLAWSLRRDERVIVMERTNARTLTQESLGETVGFATVDVSFISLKLILPVLYDITSFNASAVCLIKPQFEAGKANVGKRGVVRDKNVHIDVIENTIRYANDTGFAIGGLTYSPIRGPEGNIEFLLYLVKDGADVPVDAARVVHEASQL